MKKVLIITYYWPPAGGPGVQRWLKFVKYLPDYNIQPIVYIPENPTYPIIDEGLISEVSEQAIILKNKIIEPYQLASVFSKKSTKGISSGIIPNQKKQSFIQKLLLLVRGNLFIPDARILWVKPSVKYLEKYISENNIDTIITSGPPHSLHLIGLKLKQNLNVKWFADFRDPWTTIGYHSALKLSSYAEKKHKNLERKVLNTADTIIVTSKTTKTEFQAITTKPIEVITNGYDVENISKQTLDEKFTLAHIGSFLSDRNPIILWESLSELVAENKKFRTHFQLKLIGKVSQEILDTIDGFNLNSYVNNLGYVSHKEAIEHQKKSQILLLIEIDSEDTKSIIPGKLFEYMVSERPIIGIGPKGSDFAEIITETNTGVFFTYNEKEKLKKQILSYFELYLTQKLTVSAVGLQQYSRKKLTEKLSKLIS
ncbi:glycosyltransferase family 4 protein [Flavobacterium psychrophilum]|uniref:glycosyltransferase family 4 protein n=1 Tax=Flavobacterium psychrophilum TaxID=96345 RepID=UPI000B7C3329|nr:glycosyltransferase family 4 protein [Flavobacterium psychrophilum]EKT3956309.1 glycosyltransferase family 4 protein [Flavobacterium psychrophilum]EKT3963989.1 glycosyltransferase family 4 protein [Flavobacterium psychrophilum]SNB18020.1 Glycosyl transferase, group 1 family protein [Flavobacterium psychrophilum]SNB22227.1 Glycosyl transferase, group 1 family protein [Flavobacterium psychrophilum]GEJ30475.1 glycosyl transferase family 1 [Flavobacterium psychrophilum]